MAKKWRTAKSIDVFRLQVNEEAPNRSKTSDGTVGDLAHSNRKSDHNPNANGVVTAIDITHDPKGGMDCHKLAYALTQSGDPRIKYIIWHGRITEKGNIRKWKPYQGPNPHNHHLHLSVSSDPKLYDRVDSWDLSWLAEADKSEAVTEEIPVTEIQQHAGLVKRGDRGAAVRLVQTRLVAHEILKQSDVDGDFGVRTELAVINFQKKHKLGADGIVGEKTRRKLMEDPQ